MRYKVNLKSLLPYVAYALALVALNTVLPQVPLSLGLCFSMLICGANIIAVPVIYILSSVVNLNLTTSLLALFEGVFLTLITLLYRKTKRKIKAEAGAYMIIALAPFVVFSKWEGIESLYLTQNAYIIKAVASASVIVFTYFCFRTVYALLFRLCRCKLKTEELICIAVFFTAVGVGVRNLIGEYPYICVVCAVTSFAVRLTKNPASLIISLIASLPLCIVSLELQPLTFAVLTSVIALIFSSIGRWAVCGVTALCTALAFYLKGLYFGEITSAVLCTVLLVTLCIAVAIPSENAISKLNSLLTLKKVLPRAEEDRLKEQVAEKLYRTSEVFREIESAFNALDDGPDEEAMKKRLLAETKRAMCITCDRAETCKNAKVYKGFATLIDTGCLKGKVNFVDLTADVTKNCKDPSRLTETVNKLLYEYRKSTLEAENAKNGRRLLAEQARGVAQVLKSRATEFCREDRDFTKLEKKVASALAFCGFSCPELEIKGDEDIRISLTLIDCNDFSPVKECIEKAVGFKLMLQNKTAYDSRKCAYRLVRPPIFDAGFGVAYAVKDGERTSGDTHSVIKINEHKFLMALSDGMGSGEYARKVSETAISLIEAFCRSEMPEDVMLDTVNKLLCFNRDERFTCIDVATIDLNTLTACFIKIGSPVGLIVRKGEIKVLESRSLPLGILDNLRPATSCEQLKKNDIVVFMSDGITSAFNGVSDLYEFVGGLKPLNPQALAEKILASAKERTIGTPDDMTVLCVRLYEKSESGKVK
ncbi:MAG: SpoIIE family protein phosphatase [Candidatus Coproplasma sp.]